MENFDLEAFLNYLKTFLDELIEALKKILVKD